MRLEYEKDKARLYASASSSNSKPGIIIDLYKGICIYLKLVWIV